MSKTKSCTSCQQLLSIEFFYNSKNSPDGKSWACKNCQNSYKKGDVTFNKLDKNGHRIHKSRKFDDEVILDLYFQKLSSKFVLEELNCSYIVLHNCLKRNNIEYCGKEKIRQFKINENFFNIIDSEEKAYWLGFLYADGYVNERDGHIKIALHEQDENHLQKFLNCLDSNYEIKEYRKGYKEVRIWSRTMTNDLVKHGCIQAKSGKIKFPSLLNGELTRHFIRGYFDGDGGVTIGLKNRLSLNFTGYNLFLSELLNYINEELGIEVPKFYIRRKESPNFGSYHYSGLETILKLVKFFYMNSFIYLDRKFEKIIKNLKDKYNAKYTYKKSKLLIYDLNKKFQFLEKKIRVYDIDSVLADFVSGIIQRAKELGYENSFPSKPEDVSCWKICEDFYEVFKTTFKDKEFWVNLELMSNIEKDFQVDYYLTARCIPNSWTEKWISKMGLPKGEVITVDTPLDKIKILKTLNPLFFVDDHWWTVKEARDEGINAYLFKQPYQQGHQEEIDKYKIPVIESLGELDKYV